MPPDLELATGRFGITLFEFVTVCIALFYTWLESGRQNRSEYSALSWTLAAYFGSVSLDILADPTLALYAFQIPFCRVVSDGLATAAFLGFAYTLVSGRLLDQKSFVRTTRILAFIWGGTFVIFAALAAAYPEIGVLLFWHPPMLSHEERGIFPGEWVFSLQQAFLLLYALVVLWSQVREKSIYLVGFFVLLAAGRFFFMIRLVAEQISRSMAAMPSILESLVDPLAFLLLVMVINQMISEDLQKLNQQLMRRTEQLEEATRSLQKLNQLSSNLLQTTKTSDIAETILKGLEGEFGFLRAFLLLLDRNTCTLKGFRLGSDGRSREFMASDATKRHFLRTAMLKGKPSFLELGSQEEEREFLKEHNVSKNLVTVPLLTKKETTCYEIYDCDKATCPVLARGAPPCWLWKAECPYHRAEDPEDITPCLKCRAFNVVGMLVLENRHPRHLIDEENLAFLETFANQAGMALQNASLVEDLSREVSFRESTFRSLPNGVMVLGESGYILSLNPTLVQIVGRPESELTGIPFEAVRVVDDEDRFHEIVDTVLKLGKSYEGIGETWTLTLPERTLKLNIKVNPLPGTGNRYGAVILFEDITEVSALQEQVIRSEKLATIGQMAAGIAHEVNNPLAGVSGFLQVMSSRLPEDSPERIAMQAALSNINRASGTIRDLLKFARLGPASKKLTSLNEVIEESLVFVQFHREHGQIDIHRHFADNLPQVVVDPDQMRQVFTNLVLNAVQAMGETGTLTVTTVASNGRVRVFLEDTGHGIPKQHFGSIFEPWFTTKLSKGTGLGLTNSDRIIAEHGGVLAFSSVEGQGTTFVVDIPIQPADQEK